MTTHKVPFTLGVDDLTKTNPYSTDEWGTTTYHGLWPEDEYKENPEAYVEFVNAKNNEYIKRLEENGSYGKTDNYELTITPCSVYDSSRLHPTEHRPLESCEMQIIDLSKDTP